MRRLRAIRLVYHIILFEKENSLHLVFLWINEYFHKFKKKTHYMPICEGSSSKIWGFSLVILPDTSCFFKSTLRCKMMQRTSLKLKKKTNQLIINCLNTHTLNAVRKNAIIIQTFSFLAVFKSKFSTKSFVLIAKIPAKPKNSKTIMIRTYLKNKKTFADIWRTDIRKIAEESVWIIFHGTLVNQIKLTQKVPKPEKKLSSYELYKPTCL